LLRHPRIPRHCQANLRKTSVGNRCNLKTPHKTFLDEALKRWEKTCIGNIKNKLSIAKETIWLLDQAQERMSLSNDEVEFRRRIKYIYLGLLAIEKIKARQRAWLTNIKYGDVSSKLFFLRANGRKIKKHIQVLQTEQGLAFKHEDKLKKLKSISVKCLGRSEGGKPF
jgi:hypothetical protein